MYKALFFSFMCVFGILSHPCSGYAQPAPVFPMPNGTYQTKEQILPSGKYPQGSLGEGVITISGTGKQRNLMLNETLNYVDADNRQKSEPFAWKAMWTADGGKVYYSEPDESGGKLFSVPITATGFGFETATTRYSKTVGQMIEFKGEILPQGANEYLSRVYYKDTNGNWQLYAERTYTLKK